MPLSIKVGYQPPKKKSALEFNELQLQAEVDEIIERNEALRKEKRKNTEEADAGENGTKEEKTKSAPKTLKEKRFGKEMKKPFVRRDFRKSDDPNMIYGRDFDDPPIELSQVLGEMGEITIRGKGALVRVFIDGLRRSRLSPDGIACRSGGFSRPQVSALLHDNGPAVLPD